MGRTVEKNEAHSISAPTLTAPLNKQQRQEAQIDIWCLVRPAMMRALALLLVCAAASDVKAGTALTYLRAYNPPPLLRLLIHDRVDYGRRCNFLHAIAASLNVWAQFPWVLTLDGPNNLPVPRDFALIAAFLRHVEPNQHPPTSLLGDNTSTAKEVRWSHRHPNPKNKHSRATQTIQGTCLHALTKTACQ